MRPADAHIHIDRHIDHATSVTIGRILRYSMLPNKIASKTSGMAFDEIALHGSCRGLRSGVGALSGAQRGGRAGAASPASNELTAPAAAAAAAAVGTSRYTHTHNSQ